IRSTHCGSSSGPAVAAQTGTPVLKFGGTSTSVRLWRCSAAKNRENMEPMHRLNVVFLTILGSSLLCASPLSIANSGLESPDISFGFGGCSGTTTGSIYIYDPTGCGQGWTFQGGSGLTRNPSGFNNPVGPDGSAQSAFLQNSSGTFFQSITGIDAGSLY